MQMLPAGGPFTAVLRLVRVEARSIVFCHLWLHLVLALVFGMWFLDTGPGFLLRSHCIIDVYVVWHKRNLDGQER